MWCLSPKSGAKEPVVWQKFGFLALISEIITNTGAVKLHTAFEENSYKSIVYVLYMKLVIVHIEVDSLVPLSHN